MFDGMNQWARLYFLMSGWAGWIAFQASLWVALRDWEDAQ